MKKKDDDGEGVCTCKPAGSNMRGIYCRKERHAVMDSAKRDIDRARTKSNQIDPRNEK